MAARTSRRRDAARCWRATAPRSCTSRCRRRACRRSRGRRHLDRGHGRPALHGLPWQQRAPRRLCASACHRGDQGAARRAELRAAPLRQQRAIELAEALGGEFRALTGAAGKALFTTGGSRCGRGRDQARAHRHRALQDAELLGRVSRRGLRRIERRRRVAVPLAAASARCCRAPSTSRRSAAIAAPTATAVDADGQPFLDAMPARLRGDGALRARARRRRRGGHRRAGARRAVHAAARLLAGRARRMPRARHAADLRRDPDRPRQDRTLLRGRARRRRARHRRARQGAGRRCAADRRRASRGRARRGRRPCVRPLHAREESGDVRAPRSRRCR